MARRDDEIADLRKRFAHHPPTKAAVAMHESVRRQFRRMTEELTLLVPPSREQALMLTKLEEAMMWANAGIAREISAKSTEAMGPRRADPQTLMVVLAVEADDVTIEAFEAHRYEVNKRYVKPGELGDLVESDTMVGPWTPLRKVVR